MVIIIEFYDHQHIFLEKQNVDKKFGGSNTVWTKQKVN
jgi:hypothetical protein